MVQNTASPDGRRVIRSLLDVDDELAAAVPAAEREAAQRALGGLEVRLANGPARLHDLTSVAALYVAGGLLRREVALGTVAMPELLAEGDFLRPRTVRVALGWGSVTIDVVEPVTLIALDDRFESALSHWPGLHAVVERRTAERHHRSMLVGAIGHLPRVEQRVMALLWLLATEWGRLERDGLVVPFPLTHATIGRFVGAARSTVTIAVTELTAAGLLQRRADECWLLPAVSRVAVGELLGLPANMPAIGVRRRASRPRSEKLERTARRAIAEAAITTDESAALRAEARQARSVSKARRSTDASLRN